jgi:hypothetical protein
MEIMEPKEAWIRLHTQEVRGSSPCAPTITFSNLQPHCMALTKGCTEKCTEGCRLWDGVFRHFYWTVADSPLFT